MTLVSSMSRFALTITLLAVLNVAIAADIYVSPEGRDTNVGSRERPLATLEAARDKARASAGIETVTIHVADGVYYLPETLVFDPNDSGTADAPVVYRAINEGGAVLSGGSRLELEWTAHRAGIFKADTPKGIAIDQLFIDGVSQRMARYPNYDAKKTTDAWQGFAADAFSSERAANWANPTGGFIHAMHAKRWGGYHYRITGKNAQGEVTYDGGWQNNRQMGMHDDFRMVENIFEELDAPGEWFHDSDTDTLYYLPETGFVLNKAKVEVVRLRSLVEFRGSEAAPVKHVTLQGFVVRHAARTFMDTKEPLLRSDWTIYRGGAFLLTGTEDVSILDFEFDQVGGNAIFVNKYNRRILIKGCHIHDAGASGISFVGDPGAVRDPLFEYSQKNNLSNIDRTPGPKNNDYPSAGVVADCLIHGIGRVERQPAGVQISMAMDITVRDTTIYDTSRAGINVSDGTWGGHLIERVDVFDTVLETHDHGSFNSWGRDRYWRSDHRETSQQAVDADPGLPFIDAMKATVIRDSRWRSDHGWDIDLDDGSSNYDIYNNLMLSGGLKLREGYRRRAWNNITVNNGLHAHVWFNNSNDQVHSNIFMMPHRDIRVNFGGQTVDRNLFFSNDPNVMKSKREQGWDVNSIVADPLFEDPERGDFRVKSGSPALDVGFSNFPMDQFGVKKPKLRAIARTPVIPPLVIFEDPSSENTTDAVWLGAQIHALQGEEYSAFGVSKEAGGIAVLEIPVGSAAAVARLKVGDLIQSVNGNQVSTIAQLFGVLERLGDVPMKLELVRHGHLLIIELEERL